jgi:lipid-binding SYLF domain-containing protein
MNRVLQRAVLLLAVPAMLLAGGTARADEQTDKIAQATAVLDKIMQIPESAIPPSLLNNAYGLAVIPGVIKAGFILGGRYGTGVVLVRQDGQWSNPSFVSIAGGSVGWQIGAQSTDVILVFKSRRSVEGMMKGKFTLGADAAVAAGPVGRRVEGATDVMLKAEILSYSRTRGFFAGVSLEGSALQIDDDANAAYYHRPGVTAREIFAGQVSAPASAAALRRTVARHARTP